MTEYQVFLKQMAHTAITVEANGPEDAVEKSWNEQPSLCAQCAGMYNPPGISLDYDWELDYVRDTDGNVLITGGEE